MGLISVDDALSRLAEAVAPLPAESLAVGDALDRVTRERLKAQCDLPPFDQSSMDGYAVRSTDLVNAPNSLELSGVVAAGLQERRRTLRHGTTCRIFTGGMIPEGADAVVRQEWTQRIGDTVIFDRPAPQGQDIRRRGEELALGSPLLEAGLRLNAGHLGLLSMAGCGTITVSRAPRIRVLVSGDEVISPGQPLGPGQVYDANGPLLCSWLARGGYREVTVERLPDEEAAVVGSLSRAFDEADLILSSGGVSVGDRDLIVPSAEAVGAERVLWKVAQKPGKPLYVARKGRSILMGLPGNPASVLANLAVFVRYALDVMEGVADRGPQLRSAVLVKGIERDARRDRWVRIQVENDERGLDRATPLNLQGSHMPSNLAVSNALAWIRAGEGSATTGSVVQYLNLGL